MKLFGNFFNEKIVGAIGLISQIVEMAVLAFANRTWFVFLGEYCLRERLHVKIRTGARFITV